VPKEINDVVVEIKERKKRKKERKSSISIDLNK
jgi:hypothetical protein